MGRSGRRSPVAMMQSAENAITDHGARAPRLNRPRPRRLLAQPEVRLRLVAVGDVPPQYAPQMAFAEHDHVVQAYTPDRSDDRSTQPSRHGDWSPMIFSSMSGARSVATTSSPQVLSRSRIT